MTALTKEEKAELYENFRKMSHEQLLQAIMELTELHEKAMVLLRQATKRTRH